MPFPSEPRPRDRADAPGLSARAAAGGGAVLALDGSPIAVRDMAAPGESGWKRTGLWQALRRLRGRARKLRRKLPKRPSRRHANPYATHLPVLIGVAAIVRPKAFLEYGSGVISTPTLLDRSMFPDLESVVSLENDAEWLDRVAAATDDARLELRLVDGSVRRAVAAAEVNAADMVLIDDSRAVEDRAATIEAVLDSLDPAVPTTILVHDAETPEYLSLLRSKTARGGSLEGAHLFVFDAFEPHTGCLSTDPRCTPSRLRALNRRIARQTATTQPDDLAAWADLLINRD